MQSCGQIFTINKPAHNFLEAGCRAWHPVISVKALKQKVSHSLDLLLVCKMKILHCERKVLPSLLWHWWLDFRN